MQEQGKLLIFSAPSGSGKTTLVRYIMEKLDNMSFSISATSRPPRGQEAEGQDYYFLSADEFREKIKNNEFVEWEEVYEGRYYGTLKSEVERIRNMGRNVVFDVDVIGGLNIKKMYGDNSLAVFIKPPDIKTLETRLRNRNTDSDEDIRIRVEKAEFELTFAKDFDVIITNNKLQQAQADILKAITHFLNLD